MRNVLESEQYVEVPPLLYSDPFFRITMLIKEEIRKFKWTEGEKGRALTWEQARQEWTANYRDKFERYLMETLHIGTTGGETPFPSPSPSGTTGSGH